MNHETPVTHHDAAATPHGTHQASADEQAVLAGLLQHLEQAEHLSLDELDAIILQADAAYRGRLARLEHTRQLIAQLGETPLPP